MTSVILYNLYDQLVVSPFEKSSLNLLFLRDRLFETLDLLIFLLSNKFL